MFLVAFGLVFLGLVGVSVNEHEIAEKQKQAQVEETVIIIEKLPKKEVKKHERRNYK